MNEEIRDLLFRSLKRIYIFIIAAAVLIPVVYFVYGTDSMTMIIKLLLLLVFIFVISFSTSCFCKNNMFWEEYSYLLYYNKFNFYKTDDGKMYYGDLEMARKIKSNIDFVDHIEIILHKSEISLPIRLLGDVEFLDTYRENGSVRIHQPHKNSDIEIRFRVSFDPPLKKNEAALFALKFRAESVKDLNTEYIEKFAHDYDFEYNSLYIYRRIHECGFDVHFDNDCNVDILGCDVTRGESFSAFESEAQAVEKNNCFQVYEDSEGQHIKFLRYNPPIGTRYMFKWRPRKLT